MTGIPNLTLEEEKAKNKIVLSTCVGYGQKKPPKQTQQKTTNQQTQTHSCWGHTIKRSVTSLMMWIPHRTNFSGCLLVKQERPSIHHCWTILPHYWTILPLHEHCSAAKSIIQVYCLSYGSYHMNTDPAENRRSFVCIIQSVIISGFHLACYFASQETEQLDWQQAKPNS